MLERIPDPGCGQFVQCCLQILDKRYRESRAGRQFWLAGSRKPKKFSERELTDETGINWPALKDGRRRSLPPREIVMLLADYLECSLNERNELLAAAHYSPVEPLLTGDALEAALKPARLTLYKYLPYPAYIVNRNWDILEINPAALTFLQLDGDLLRQLPPECLNILWLVFDPALPLRPMMEAAEREQWEAVARREVLGFRLDNRLCTQEVWYSDLIRQLSRLPDFARIYAQTEPGNASDQESLEFVTRLRLPDGSLVKVKSLFARTGNWAYPQIILNVPGDRATEALYTRLGFSLPAWCDQYITL